MIRSVMLGLVVMACVEPSEPIEPQVTSRVARIEQWVQGVGTLDLLLVIDSSPAMADHRENVRANVRRFATLLEELPHGLPDLHVGVVTADVGTRGSLDSGPTAPLGSGDGACTSDGDAGRLRTHAARLFGTFINDRVTDVGTRVRNYYGSFADMLVRLADVGSRGCVLGRPLEAMRRALTNPDNAGFVREDAFLMVVFITAGDDCSFASASFLEGTSPPVAFRCISGRDELLPVEEYASLLKLQKDDPSKVIVAGALGPASPVIVDLEQRTIAPSCDLEGRTARPAVRLHSFLDQFPNRAAVAPLCAADLGDVLLPLTTSIKVTLGEPCFDVPLADLDPVAPGTQPECNVWYRFPSGDEELIRACSVTGSPCWELRPEPQLCFDPGLTLKLAHRADLLRGTRMIAECVAQ